MMCLPCHRAHRKPGRHRAHRCTGGGVAGSIGYVCSCACNRPTSRFVPPVMALPLIDPVDTARPRRKHR